MRHGRTAVGRSGTRLAGWPLGVWMNHPGTRAGRTIRLLAVTVALGAGLTRAANDRPQGSPVAAAALALCYGVEELPADEQRPTLLRGLALAEEAEATDADDPVAHLAVFCNLGKRLRMEGVSLHILGDLVRLRRELGTTLALAPDFPDAVAAEGAYLCALPRWLGGEPVEGERLLRRALGLDPENVAARLILAEALHARGARDEAQTHLTLAISLLEQRGWAVEATQAREFAARLQ